MATNFVPELPLIDASELWDNIQVTPIEQDRLAIRSLIINANNTGAVNFIWNKPLLPELKTELEAAGYVCFPNPHAARPTDQWIIQVGVDAQ